jgi:hypothetical protein
VTKKVASRRHPISALKRATLAAALLCAAIFQAGTARGDGFNAFVNYNFVSSDFKSTDPTGVTSKSSSSGFMQLYNLSVSRTLYPSLIFDGGVIFQHNVAHTDSSGVSSTNSTTQTSPNANLLFTNSFMPSALGYSRREERSSFNGNSTPASILESYTARTSLKFEELPPVDLNYSRFHSYDEHKLQRDLTSDSLLWGTSLQPTRELSLSYQGAWTSSENAITKLTSDSLSNSARAGYSRTFWDNRVMVATNYNLASTSTTVTSAGANGGDLLTNQLPLNGALSSTTSTVTVPPLTPTTGALASNPALLTGSANLNMIAVTPPPVGTRINLGLDFGFGNATAVNTLYLTMVSGTNNRPENLLQIAGINQLFSWDLYTSTDGVNWTLVQNGVPQHFGPDPSGLTDTVGFTLSFATTVASRFIKVVAAPVPVDNLFPYSTIQGVDIKNIAVSRLQAYLKSPVTLAGHKSTTGSLAGQFGFTASARLMENLTYDLGLGLSHGTSTGAPTTVSWFTSNGLGYEKTISSTINTSARVSLQQQKTGDTPMTSNLSYSAGMSILPLPTLNDSITYSGGVSNIGEANELKTNSFFLSNTAQLYQGVSFAFSGGYSTSSQKAGQTNDTVTFSTGLSLAPRRDLSMSLSYGQSVSDSSGGPIPPTHASTQTTGLSVSYTPFPSLYLAGSFSVANGSDQATTTSQNYSLGWSPLRGGDLSVNVAYSESRSTPDNVVSRNLTPSLRWKVTPRATLDGSYQYFNSSSTGGGESVGNSFSLALRLLI